MLHKVKILAIVGAMFLATSSYAQNKGGSLWVTGGGLTACGQKAYDMLRNSSEQGLSPADFQYGVNAVDRARSGQMSWAQAGSQLNDAMVRYIDQIRRGRFYPRSADHHIIMVPDASNAHAVIAQGAASGGCDWLDNLEPPYEGYRQLKPVLAKFRQIAANNPTWPRLPENITIAQGDSSDAVAGVGHILYVLGYLSSDGNNYFDGDMQEALKQYQAQHGLLVDGRLGPQTLKDLNKTAQDRVNQIIITMERWRWMPRNPGQRYIRVNIAGFQLEAVQNGQVVLRSPIIVGTDYRETPVFSATMTEVKFNPSWHVPYGLAVKDKLPKLREDPSWAASNNFVITTNVGGREREVDARSINWHRVSEGNFPYQLRQRPGSNNALGKIRFTIISPFNVYLHSTPDQHLFDYPIRTFSSGCIRVKKVAELGEFAFNNPSVWPASRIEQEMQGTNTKAVPLGRNIPVHVTYFTVWVDEQGQAHFNPDVYGQDREIAKTMRRWL